MQKNNKNILKDIESINQIPAVTNILEIICKTTGMGFSAVARVTAEKWVACAVNDEINFGLTAGGELKLETTICNEIRQHQNPVVINHVAEDLHFSSHHTALLYGFQSYISVPIILKNGSFFGTLCAIDPKPAKLNNPTVIGMFKMFADLIAFHLDTLEQLAISEERLQVERETSELREQFIAILGHDLRNPLNAIANSAQLLARINHEDRTQKLVNIIKDSSFRMNGLIENMLDFASGRLGGGITISATPDEDLEKILFQVIEEIHAISPDKKMKLNFDVTHPVNADGKRIAQLFSNLLGNALSYSPAESTIEITAESDDEQFTLCVANPGKKIPEAAMERLFQPFSRGEVEPNQKGLGLGLYIASEIAKAHGGSLAVSSSETQTCFTLSLPILK
ncbi:GAF domain-containing protein [Pedobacter chinensis]|uniref:histidine kinase n=1 Tax=Pedobacter chinensis TaxID=2282421 RepID=A0A369Q069_9SPHI|nr:GAF domain-containing sensor histidine kinase [Pedobacter chinensis]RDC57890.1 GAF domain-containing protein [Pedobacter chinensis]